MLVYDAEIKRCIPDPRVENDPRYEYCDGWDDFVGMGISVITTFDLNSRQPRVFLEDNFSEFTRSVAGRILFGFNSAKFDDNLLIAHSLIPHEQMKIDLLSAIRVAAGEPAGYTAGLTRGSRRLGGLAGVNGVPYYGNGVVVDAPRRWQDGEHGIVIDYCLRDTMMLAGLVDKARAQGYLIDSATGRQLDLPLKEAFLRGRAGKSLAAAPFLGSGEAIQPV